MSKKFVIFVAVLCMVIFLVPVSGFAGNGLDTQGLNQAGSSLSQGIKDLASGDFGKGLFFLAFFIGILIMIFVPRFRTYALLALFVGVLLASFTGLSDTLWKFFGGIFSSGGS